jgi:MFS family permease
VLIVPGARALFVSAVPARIGVAMTNLGLLWLVRWGTDSYAAAGIVTGVFAVTSALAAPLFGRLSARFGQARVLVPTALVHAGAIAGLITAVAARCPLWTIGLVGVVAGAALPQISSLTATRWSVLLTGSSALPTAFALESLSNELAYLLGPALVATVSAVVAPAGVALAAALDLLGCLALARQRATDPGPNERSIRQEWRLTSARSADGSGGGTDGASLSAGSGSGGGRGSGGGQLRAGWGSDGARLSAVRGFVLLALINVGIGFFFGALQISVTAFATGHGSAGSAGLIYSLLSVTSLAAGFGYGARKWRLAVPRQLVVALGVLTAGSLPMVFAGTPILLAMALLLPGFGLAPSMIVVSLLAERIVVRSALTRAFAVLNSAGAVGTALASAVAGTAVDAHGAEWGFAIAVGAVGAGMIVAVVAAARAEIAGGWWSGRGSDHQPATRR